MKFNEKKAVVSAARFGKAVIAPPFSPLCLFFSGAGGNDDGKGQKLAECDRPAGGTADLPFAGEMRLQDWAN